MGRKFEHKNEIMIFSNLWLSPTQIIWKMLWWHNSAYTKQIH